MATQEKLHPELAEYTPAEVLAFVAARPDALIGPDTPPTASRLETAYRFGFDQVSRAITDERERRELAQALCGLVADDLMREAFHASFPDEVGQTDATLAQDLARCLAAADRQLAAARYEMKKGNVLEFQTVIDRLLARATELDMILGSTNDQRSHLTTKKDYAGRTNELYLTLNRRYQQQRILIYHGDEYCVAREETVGRPSDMEYYEELDVTSYSFDPRQGAPDHLVAGIWTVGAERLARGLGANDTRDALNRYVFQVVNGELDRRQSPDGQPQY